MVAFQKSRDHKGEMIILSDLFCLVPSGTLSQSCVPECSGEFSKDAILHSFLNTTLLYYPYFQSEKAYEAKPTGNKRAYISL